MEIRNRNSRKFKLPEFILILLILISGICLSFSSGKFIISFKTVGFSIVSTVEKGAFYIKEGVVGTFNSIGQLRKLRKDYNALVDKLENYEQMQRSNAEIRKENERLKEQLGFVQSLDEKNIPAQIISRDLESAYSYLTINKGSVNGIRKGMPVVAFQNGSEGLVGKVIQVAPFTCQVMPIYNSDCIISARILNTRDLGLVNGMGSSDQPLILEYIRKRVLDDLNIGDIIVTSGENDNYMRDVPIGTISKITVIDYNSSLNIELNPIIDFSRLENLVVINQKETNDRKPVTEATTETSESNANNAKREVK